MHVNQYFLSDAEYLFQEKCTKIRATVRQAGSGFLDDYGGLEMWLEVRNSTILIKQIRVFVCCPCEESVLYFVNFIEWNSYMCGNLVSLFLLLQYLKL